MKYPLRIFVTYVQANTQQTNQELYEKYQSSHYEKYEWGRETQAKVLHHQKCSIHYTTIFNLLHSKRIQDLVENHLSNQGSHYEKKQKNGRLPPL